MSCAIYLAALSVFRHSTMQYPHARSSAVVMYAFRRSHKLWVYNIQANVWPVVRSTWAAIVYIWIPFKVGWLSKGSYSTQKSTCNIQELKPN